MRRSRSRGRLVHVVGPDGSGKSTLAAALAEHFSATHRVLHDYWRPGVLPAAGRLIGKAPSGLVTDPHRREPHSPLRGTTRLLYYAVDFSIGFWIRYAPVLRRGGIVIVERGWTDTIVDPRRYLIRGTRLARILANVIPGARPDLLLVLEAPSATVFARKQELAADEITRQISTWRDVGRARDRIVHLDAQLPRDDLLERAAAAIDPSGVGQRRQRGGAA